MASADVRGLRDFRKELRDLDRAWPKELTAAHKDIGKFAADGARGLAIGLGGVHAKAERAIKGYGNQTSATVGVQASASVPFANVAFWGWNRGRPKWVGNDWDAATFSGGPYAINRALFFDLQKILDRYMELLDGIARRAFPN